MEIRLCVEIDGDGVVVVGGGGDEEVTGQGDVVLVLSRLFWCLLVAGTACGFLSFLVGGGGEGGGDGLGSGGGGLSGDDDMVVGLYEEMLGKLDGQNEGMEEAPSLVVGIGEKVMLMEKRVEGWEKSILMRVEGWEKSILIRFWSG